ncbi:uncharacterized protein LOC130895146 [Diorhabda carinulata]|uniref:uncharacterized protein LOC130895146 n=1 Tax=Diorhabda carinulata TaxID=1163345 RepID=UPI0025A10F70|nr:uncharacterized protein LOC130895146 [Diorhabda carinulata]
MYDVRIILCVLLVTCTLRASTKTDESDNLQLSKIFCTPKDFSRVNFDHFEILERNNFDPPVIGSSTEDESTGGSKQHPKSFANAQVMLRIGGDDIKGKNCIDCPQKLMTKVGQPYPVPHSTGIHHHDNQLRSSGNPFLPYSFGPQMNQYTPISPYMTVAPVAPSFVFPGYIYNPSDFPGHYRHNGEL